MASLWKPVTYGEELFINLYEDLGSHLKVSAPQDVGTDFLVNAEGFQTFTRLTATSEVFFRSVRCAADVYSQQPGSHPRRFAEAVRREVDLPARISNNSKFAERLKGVGRVVSERVRHAGIEHNATRSESSTCYLCGVPFTSTGRTQRSIEHIWPLSLGGETIEPNLVLACQDCNSKRGHMMTCVHGTVHSTYYTRSSTNPVNPDGELRLSLALARLMQDAAPTRARKSPLTLKEAIHQVRPAIPHLDIDQDKPYVYFELLQHIQVSL